MDNYLFKPEAPSFETSFNSLNNQTQFIICCIFAPYRQDQLTPLTVETIQLHLEDEENPEFDLDKVPENLAQLLKCEFIEIVTYNNQKHYKINPKYRQAVETKSKKIFND
jgi:hypothetical protein